MNTRPVVINANGKEVSVSLPCSVEEFVRHCGWKATQVVVEHNGQVLARSTLDRVQLQEGDRIEVITPVAGG